MQRRGHVKDNAPQIARRQWRLHGQASCLVLVPQLLRRCGAGDGGMQPAVVAALHRSGGLKRHPHIHLRIFRTHSVSSHSGQAQIRSMPPDDAALIADDASSNWGEKPSPLQCKAAVHGDGK